MVQRVDTIFDEFTFSAEERRTATTFSELNRYFLRSRLAQLCIQRLQLLVNAADTREFMQQEAYLRGKGDMLAELLAEEELTLKEIIDEAAAKLAEDKNAPKASSGEKGAI